jgi:hypothetical protein
VTRNLIDADHEDGATEAAAASQLVESAAVAKHSKFVIIFAISAVGVMALWIALLIWLAIRVIF